VNITITHIMILSGDYVNHQELVHSAWPVGLIQTKTKLIKQIFCVPAIPLRSFANETCMDGQT